MSYTSIEELPHTVRNSFTPDSRTKWMMNYNSCLIEIENGNAECIEDYTAVESATIRAWESMKEAPDSRYFSAQITAEVIDLQGEVAAVKDYMASKRDFLNEGGMGQAGHTSIPAYNIWYVWEDVDPVSQKPSICVKGNFYRDLPTFDREWSKFVSGRNEFSMGSSVQRTRHCDDFTCYGVIRPTQWFEVSNVEKGANPRTGVLDVHIPEGEGSIDNMKFLEVKYALKEFHPTECPIKLKYESFKSDVLSILPDAEITWLGDGITVEGTDLNRVITIAKDYYSEDYISTIDPYIFDPEEAHEKFFILFKDSLLPVNQTTLFDLIIDELQAIDGYERAKVQVKSTDFITENAKEKICSQFDEIINDEADHARILYRMIEQGFNSFVPVEDAVKSECPEGQHSHAGVAGCHDITRDHHKDEHAIGSDVLDLTDEEVDVNNLRAIDTPRLQRIVTAIATTIKKYDDESIDRFMSSTMGKEFVLMVLELKDRKHNEQERDIMTEKEVDTVSTEADATKSEIDMLVNDTNILTLITAINFKMDKLATDILAIQSAMAVQSGSRESISDAVSNAVEGITAPGNEDIPVTTGDAEGVETGDMAEEKEESSEVETVEEKSEEEDNEGESKGDADDKEPDVEPPKGEDSKEPEKDVSEEKTEEKVEEKVEDKDEEKAPTKKDDEEDAKKSDVSDSANADGFTYTDGSDGESITVVEGNVAEKDCATKTEDTIVESAPDVAQGEVDKGKPAPIDVATGTDAFYGRLEALKTQGVTVTVSDGFGKNMSYQSARSDVVLTAPASLPKGTMDTTGDSNAYSAKGLSEMYGQDPDKFFEYLRKVC